MFCQGKEKNHPSEKMFLEKDALVLCVGGQQKKTKEK
jgi:hypothetical protein